MALLTQATIQLLFDVPDAEGAFAPEQFQLARELGRQRPVVLFAFPPKAAGTFLRAAAITAVNGVLIRTVHAQGGRDAQLYLPAFVGYYSGDYPGQVLVSHVHMQALAGNIHFLDAFDIRPVVMARSIPDMLTSFRDMLDSDAQARADGLNCLVPDDYLALDDAAKADFLIDCFAPWYASFYASWFAAEKAAPLRVLMLHYRDFVADPAKALERALNHAGAPRAPGVCREACDRITQERENYRFNRGKRGRGARYFEPRHLAQLERLLDHYPVLAPHLDELLGRGAFAAKV